VPDPPFGELGERATRALNAWYRANESSYGPQTYRSETRAWMTPDVWHRWVEYPHFPTGATTVSNIWPSWAAETTGNTIGLANPDQLVIRSGQEYIDREAQACRRRLAEGDRIRREDPGRPRRVMIERNRARAQRLRRKQAERRAHALLIEHLDDRQRDEWERHEYFNVVTADGLRRYRIKLGLAQNITLTSCEGEHPYAQRLRVGMALCAHIDHDEWVPNADNCLAQKLMIETAEDAFIALANF
jgi:hypothetical protein